MNPDVCEKELELLYMVVNYGYAGKAVKIAKTKGAVSATVMNGRGTVSGRILNILDLSEIKKEIVLIIAERTVTRCAAEAVADNFHLDRPNRGIAFTVPVIRLVGAKSCNNDKFRESKGENIMHKAIFAIVDRGMAETAIESANRAGAKGGTIIHARGSGIHETNLLFSMPVEPEKEIVLILAETSSAEAIIAAIREDIQIDKPGNGIIFVQDVSSAYGLR